MNIEVGHYALVLALGCAVSQLVFAVMGNQLRSAYFVDLTVRAAKIQFYLVSLSFSVLIYGFLTNDFTVAYIAENSNTYLPWYYKMSATWAAHEGSLLLWAWILTLWTFGVAVKSGSLPDSFKVKVFGVLAVISVGFITFVLLTSNPFVRLLPAFPLIGKDLNPLLQDFGLIVHPPLLYMGYVGFAVSFAFIVAALIEGRLDVLWARWCRPWVTIAWAFLTIGIALGSWWAYYELGWGGWWFWDPVENASFMPWLAGGALIHSLAATEKRDIFKIWTAFLAITTFTLSLIGTFLVRSGVLTSVHAFASDPSRGLFILLLIGVISGGAYLILVFRANLLRSASQYSFFSRETGMLINNLLLCTACLIVFIGTLMPLVFEVFNIGKISVGPPYFNQYLLPIMTITVIFLAFAPFLKWKKNDVKQALKTLPLALLLGLLVSVTLNYSYFSFGFYPILAALLTFLISTSIFATLLDYIESDMNKNNTINVNVNSKRQSRWKIKLPSKSYLAMSIAHIGFLVSCLGIIMTSVYSVDKDVYVKQGQTVALKDLRFTMKDEKDIETDLYDAVRINFELHDANNKLLTTLAPAKRSYKISQMPIAESDIYPGLSRDVYVALGEHLDDDAWSVRVQIKPYIRLIWLGALIMAFSSLFVLIDKRYSMRRYSHKKLITPKFTVKADSSKL